MQKYDRETQTKETPCYTPMIKEAVILRLQNELKQTQQELAKYKKVLVPLQVHQELLKKLNTLAATKDENSANLRGEQEKVKKAQAQLEEAMKQTNTIFFLFSNVLSCRSPATNYALFLLERHLQLKIKVLKAGNPIELKIVDDFINCCKLYGIKFQRLLYEFYLHNFILEEEMEMNPSPFVGDVQYKHSFHLLLTS